MGLLELLVEWGGDADLTRGQKNAERMFKYLNRVPQHPRDLSFKSGLSVAEVSASLKRLELEGRAFHVGQYGGKRLYRKK